MCIAVHTYTHPATPSNCGNLLKPHLPSRARKGAMARLTTSGTVTTVGIRGRPAAKSCRVRIKHTTDAVHRLNVGGCAAPAAACLRYSRAPRETSVLERNAHTACGRAPGGGVHTHTPERRNGGSNYDSQPGGSQKRGGARQKWFTASLSR